ncbi:hypothetical protein GCM10007207_17580 [Asaia siamensis]|uniref:Uncharacterized protein n=1 Tax=Asaia siamensis TaxID=110479 RepID=A0ABQ1M159_9PROT|nr:hypothetical protein AA0323_2695 [Asaia siamensis NRIC 0323]GGC32578.1 hypothetical protein GCM10007207_17580 [Asaia siamensis]
MVNETFSVAENCECCIVWERYFHLDGLGRAVMITDGDDEFFPRLLPHSVNYFARTGTGPRGNGGGFQVNMRGYPGFRDVAKALGFMPIHMDLRIDAASRIIQ